MTAESINIAIFASGSGTNAQAIIDQFKVEPHLNITRIYSNNPQAFVLTRAESAGVPTMVFSREEFYQTEEVLKQLRKDKTDLIVLAGFMWLVPAYLVHSFEGRIVNIHPALLPKYGGKGMYGERVHQAVIENKEHETGITIHMVNEKYDDGDILFQARCEVKPDDDPDSLAARIHRLEHQHYPTEIRRLAGTLKK